MGIRNDYSKGNDAFSFIEVLSNKEFDELTELCCSIFDTSFASISFISNSFHYNKSSFGCNISELTAFDELNNFIFNYSHSIFFSENIQENENFNSKKFFLNNTEIKFFGGIKLISKEGNAIGVLTLYDKQPKSLSNNQIRSLELLANQINQLVELNWNSNEHSKIEFKYKSMVENSIMPILFSNPNTERVIDANEAACELFGYTIEEFRGLPREVYIYHDSNASQILQKRRESGITSIELIGIKKNGERFPFEGSSSIFKNNDGELRSISFITDISKRKRIENENIKLMNNSNVLFVMIDTEFRITSYNNQFRKMYKYHFGTDIEIGGLFFDYAHPLDRELEKEICGRVIKGATEENEFTLTKDGKKTSFLLKYHPTKDEKDNINGIFVTVFDITNRKNLERQLIKREQELSLIYNNVNDTVFLIENFDNENFKLVSINKSFYKISGLKKEQVIGHLLDDFIPEPALSSVKKNYQLAISTKNTITWEEEREYITGRKIIITTVTPIFNSKGKCTNLIGSLHDITAIRESEKEREKITNELSKIMQSSLDVICTIDEFGNFINVSSASEKLWGYKPSEIIGTPFIKLVVEEDIERTLLTANELINGAEYTNFENRNIKKDGGIVPIIWSIRWDINDRLIYCTAKDASIQKTYEKELILSKRKYEYLFENNPAPMFIWDFETLMIVDCNEEALSIYGYKKEEFLQLNIKQIRPIEELATFEKIKSIDENFGKVVKYTTKHLKKNGEVIIVKVNAHIMKYNGRKSSLVLIEDITEKTKIQEEIINSEKKYKYLFEHNPASMYIFDFETFKIVDCNDEVLLNYGYTREEFLQLNITQIRPAEEVPFVLDFIQTEDQKGSKVVKFTTRHKKKNGDLINVKINAHVLEYNGRKSVLVLIDDVTEKLKIQAEIIESEKRYSELFHLSPQPKLVYDLKSLSILDINEAAIIHYGYSHNEFLKMGINDLMVDNGLVEFQNFKILPNGIRESLPDKTFKHKKKNGAIIEVELKSRIINFKDKNAEVILVNDITEKSKYLHSIEQQNELLKEIAWMQSHVVRAPLAKVMGFIDLINTTNCTIDEKTEMLPYILKSAKELDEIIKEIVNKSVLLNK